MSVRFTRGVAIVLAAVTLTAGGCAYLDVKQREWIFRPQRDVHATPTDVGLRYDELWLTVPGAAPEGERVHGWWIPAADARAPTMLYGPRRAAGPRHRHLRRARRAAGSDPLLPRCGARLRLLLGAPRADRATRRRAGGPPRTRLGRRARDATHPLPRCPPTAAARQ